MKAIFSALLRYRHSFWFSVLLPKPRTRGLAQAHGGRIWIATDVVAGRETFGQPGLWLVLLTQWRRLCFHVWTRVKA